MSAHELFDSFDRDQNGVIDRSEFDRMINPTQDSHVEAPPSRSELEQTVSRCHNIARSFSLTDSLCALTISQWSQSVVQPTCV